MKEPQTHTGRIAVVTGAARGILRTLAVVSPIAASSAGIT